MSKLVAGLLIVALVGLTSLVFACDLQCQMEASVAASTGDQCPLHESHPAAPKHSLHSRAVVKALGVLPVPAASIQTMSGIRTLQEVMIANTSEPPSPAALVLRI